MKVQTDRWAFSLQGEMSFCCPDGLDSKQLWCFCSSLCSEGVESQLGIAVFLGQVWGGIFSPCAVYSVGLSQYCRHQRVHVLQGLNIHSGWSVFFAECKEGRLVHSDFHKVLVCTHVFIDYTAIREFCRFFMIIQNVNFIVKISDCVTNKETEIPFRSVPIY